MSVGKILGIPESRHKYEDSPKLALARCLTGLEFECENVRVDGLPSDEEWASFWRCEKDDSLRGYGMEFVLSEPLFGQDLIDSIHGFCDWAKKNNFETNYRTGLHVHYDLRNLELDQLISMVIYYSLFEPVIFKWADRGVSEEFKRENSIFCMPMYKAEGVIDTIANAFKAGARLRDYAQRIDRYGAFNLNALSKYGSGEWRHLQCTFDEEAVLTWVNCGQSFKKYAKAHPLKPLEIVAELSKVGAFNLLSRILGSRLATEFWYEGAERAVLGIGLPVAQNLSMLLDSGLGEKWDNLRAALSPGTSKHFVKWSENTAVHPEIKESENPFDDPAIHSDPELQRIAIRQFQRLVREALDTATFP